MDVISKCMEACLKCPNFNGAVNEEIDCKKVKSHKLVPGHDRCRMGRWPEEDGLADQTKTPAKNKQNTGPVPAWKQPVKASLYNVAGKPLDLEGLYAGKSVFLICGGPSFADIDHSKLSLPGVVTMAINNAPKTFRPTMWTYVDPPEKWLQSVWLDPRIQKFACVRDRQKHVFDSDKWKLTDIKIRDCPQVFYYERNADKFNAKEYLNQPTFWWGQGGKTTDEFGQHGGRSVMLLAIRLLHYLGFRRVFLLGADFKMDEAHKYHFDQDRHKGSIRGNNATYKKMKVWFEHLKPEFKKAGLEVVNCNPDSALEVFDKVSFDKAIKMVLDEFGNIDVANERTRGLYEKDKVDKKKKPLKKAAGKATVTRSARARGKVRSDKTGKAYRAMAKAEATATAEAVGEGRTNVGSLVDAEVKATLKAIEIAQREATAMAKEQAEAMATAKMLEAEGVAA